MSCPVKVPARKHKSPSVKKRDSLRMVSFNMKKKDEEFEKLKTTVSAQILSQEKDQIKKSNLIFKLELEVSKMKFNQKRPKPNLTIMKTSNQIIPGVPFFQNESRLTTCCEHACKSNYEGTPLELAQPPGRIR